MEPAPSKSGRLTRVRAALGRLGSRDRDRHRASGCRFTIASTMADIDARAWQTAVREAGVFLQRPYLVALDAAAPQGVEHRFVLAHGPEGVVAAMVFQILSIDGAAMGGERLRGLGRLAARRARTRVLVAGNLLTWGQHALAIAPGADPALAWAALAEASWRIRRCEALSGTPSIQIMKDLPASVAPEALRRVGYRPVTTDPDMRLAIDPAWRTWDGYLAALNAKYRKQARDTEQAVAKAGIAIERCTDLRPHAAEVHRLHRLVQEKASVHPVSANPAFLPAVSRALGDGFACELLRCGPDIVGFITCIRDGRTTIGYQVGFDPEINAKAPIYFLLLYRTVAQAIAWGSAELSLGRTALEPKARLGAKPVPLAVWLRHRHRSVNLLLRPLLGLVPHDDAPERSPFKG